MYRKIEATKQYHSTSESFHFRLQPRRCLDLCPKCSADGLPGETDSSSTRCQAQRTQHSTSSSDLPEMGPIAQSSPGIRRAAPTPRAPARNALLLSWLLRYQPLALSQNSFGVRNNPSQLSLTSTRPYRSLPPCALIVTLGPLERTLQDRSIVSNYPDTGCAASPCT